MDGPLAKFIGVLRLVWAPNDIARVALRKLMLSLAMNTKGGVVTFPIQNNDRNLASSYRADPHTPCCTGDPILLRNTCDMNHIP